MFYLEYVVAILLATFVSASLYPEKWTLRFEKYKWMRPKFMLPLLIASSLLWDNHVLAWYDLIFKSGSYYQTTQSWVTAFDSAGPEDTVKIQALSEIPQTIYFKGPSSESRGNQDMADTLGVGTIVVESH